MIEDLRDVLYRKYEQSNPELLRSVVADKQRCLDIVRRVHNPEDFAYALFALAYYWPPDASVIEQCQELIANNMIHEDYRAAAMNYLAGAQAGTKDPTTVAAFLAIIRDELTIEGLRMIAYYGFLRVIDHSSSLFALLFAPISWLVPESTRDINWRLVRKWSRNCVEQQ